MEKRSRIRMPDFRSVRHIRLGLTAIALVALTAVACAPPPPTPTSTLPAVPSRAQVKEGKGTKGCVETSTDGVFICEKGFEGCSPAKVNENNGSVTIAGIGTPCESAEDRDFLQKAVEEGIQDGVDALEEEFDSIVQSLESSLGQPSFSEPR